MASSWFYHSDFLNLIFGCTGSSLLPLGLLLLQETGTALLAVCGFLIMVVSFVGSMGSGAQAQK